MKYSVGIDIGSTTTKIVVLRGDERIYEKYERHMARVREKTAQMLSEIIELCEGEPVKLCISGSAGLGLCEDTGISFVQEVYATTQTVKALEEDVSCVIELGGEDAKIIFFGAGTDERMNGSCAGGTGAFIDQMATLLDMSVDELDALSMNYQRVYPIASRCGVFAKTDIQPLLNQGARKEDVARSIYMAVVNQTVAGLAQGRKITGKVLFLGGPLHYCKGLGQCFCEVLGLDEEHAVFPEYALVSVALGAAICAEKSGTVITIEKAIDKINNARSRELRGRMPRLFSSREEYERFAARHAKATVPEIDINAYRGKAYLGIDCGSTTTKLTLISEDKSILYSYYASNKGDPVSVVKEQLCKIYEACGDRIKILGSAVTGYGEELIKNAFMCDYGIVETIAHYTAAKHFMPNVDFILDIGGQDIKCFKIKNGAIDSIMLNEACSSGCGSFLETFARSMNCEIDEFARRGLEADAPVNLGSRCTVFMNSGVKQSQKEGATVEDISAGLSVSVIKNAIYKVIRASSASELGENIVVQGGTFYNDAVLRAFETELGHDVVRPNIAGLMGAFGAAIYAMKSQHSTLIDEQGLRDFTHTSRSSVCRGCTNNCRLTVNSFGERKFISGNRCERGLGIKTNVSDRLNMYEYKRELLSQLKTENAVRSEVIGLPYALGMLELLPLWHGIFSSLGFKVKVSEPSTRRTYEKGQFSIPSDTACYPAKLMHGHIAELISDGVDAIFYPSVTYNIDEHCSDNHYNCPVVAYYSELLCGNVDELSDKNFLHPFLNINNPRELARELYNMLSERFGSIDKKAVAKAVKDGFAAYNGYMAKVKEKGKSILAAARKAGQRIMILAGRPYHIDPEICHGIDRLATSLGFAVVSEDSVCDLAQKKVRPNVLNQWTYHSRLYRAAQYACECDDVELVQLVSFGCGVDAITTDEVREILESQGKIYTQLKIDEITNLGAVKIRLRSLIGALDERRA